jgi:hypothetical protein
MKRLLLTTILAITTLANINAQAYGNAAPAAGNYQNDNKSLYRGDNSSSYTYTNSSQYTLNRNAPSATAIISNNEVTVKVNGLMNIVADSYVAMFNILQVGETISITDQLMNAKITAFKQQLKSIGIDTSEVKVDIVTFVPKYDLQADNKVFSKSYTEVPAGFELQKNISVYYKKSATLDAIVSAAANAEIYDLVKVDYYVPSLQKSYDTLRTKCLQEVKAKLKSYETIGFKLDTMRKVMNDNFTTVYPQTRYAAYTAFSRPSLNAAKKKANSVVEAPKNTSRFYNPVDYDQYDLVINPVITEPVIQLSYSIVVKYFTDEQPDKQFYIITPTGDTRQFNPK